MRIGIYIQMFFNGLFLLQPVLAAVLLIIFHAEVASRWVVAPGRLGWLRPPWRQAAVAGLGTLAAMMVLWFILAPVVLCAIILSVPMNVGLLVGIWRRRSKSRGGT